jgi:hypothetical protein
MTGASSSVVVEALCYKPEDCKFKTWWGNWIVSIYLILATLDPGVDSASNKNEYKRQI